MIKGSTLSPLLLLLLPLIASCSSFATKENARIVSVRIYGNGQITRASLATNNSGRGEIWFSARDGEQFVGEYTTIAPEVYHQDLSVFVTRVGRTPLVSTHQGFSSTASNVQYGLASAAGDRGTTVVCKYIATASIWTWSASATGTCLDSLGKSYTFHTSSDHVESSNIKTAADNPPIVLPGTESAQKHKTDTADSEQFAAFLGTKSTTENSLPATPDPPKPIEASRTIYHANLAIYAGRVVPLGSGSAMITRATFEEESPGNGRVRIVEPNNNVFEGKFTAKRPKESGTFVLITQKAANQLGLDRNDSWGMLMASDQEGSIVECVYGTLAISKRKAGLCEDSRGNKYKLSFN
jgi:hypothetical protein